MDEEARTANRKKAEKKLYRDLSCAAVLGIGAFALSIHFKNAEEQPIFSAQKDLKITKQGAMIDLSDGLGAQYDFVNKTVDHPYITTMPPIRGMMKSDITNYIGLSNEDKAKYDQIHQRACDLAAGRPGYSQVCVGLPLTPSH